MTLPFLLGVLVGVVGTLVVGMLLLILIALASGGLTARDLAELAGDEDSRPGAWL